MTDIPASHLIISLYPSVPRPDERKLIIRVVGIRLVIHTPDSRTCKGSAAHGDGSMARRIKFCRKQSNPLATLWPHLYQPFRFVVRALVSFPPVCPCVFLSYFLLLVLLLRLTLLLLLPRHHHRYLLTYQAPVPTGAARHREAWPVTHSSASSSWHSRHNLVHRNPSASPSCQCTTHTVACYLSTNLQTRA